MPLLHVEGIVVLLGSALAGANLDRLWRKFRSPVPKSRSMIFKSNVEIA
jgi:hypothetical protein